MTTNVRSTPDLRYVLFYNTGDNFLKSPPPSKSSGSIGELYWKDTRTGRVECIAPVAQVNPADIAHEVPEEGEVESIEVKQVRVLEGAHNPARVCLSASGTMVSVIQHLEVHLSWVVSRTADQGVVKSPRAASFLLARLVVADLSEAKLTYKTFPLPRTKEQRLIPHTPLAAGDSFLVCEGVLQSRKLQSDAWRDSMSGIFHLDLGTMKLTLMAARKTPIFDRLVSGDGNLLVFTTQDPIARADTNNSTDAYLARRENGRVSVRRITVRADGVEANGDTRALLLSESGRLLLIGTNASNLGTGAKAKGGPTNYIADLTKDQFYPVPLASEEKFVSEQALGFLKDQSYVSGSVFNNRIRGHVMSLVDGSVKPFAVETGINEWPMGLTPDGRRLTYVTNVPLDADRDTNRSTDLYTLQLPGSIDELAAASQPSPSAPVSPPVPAAREQAKPRSAPVDPGLPMLPVAPPPPDGNAGDSWKDLAPETRTRLAGSYTLRGQDATGAAIQDTLQVTLDGKAILGSAKAKGAEPQDVSVADLGMMLMIQGKAKTSDGEVHFVLNVSPANSGCLVVTSVRGQPRMLNFEVVKTK